MTDFPKIKLAGVLYSPQSTDKSALVGFADQMRDRGWSIGGLVQDIIRDDDGVKTGVDAVALDNGDRFPIVRPSKEDIAAGSCGLSRSVLAESSAILRRAIDAKVDVLIVEKFGEREQLGEGLVDDILYAVSEGISVLVAVPSSAIEKWTAFTGGLGELLPCELSALTNWWERDNLFEELVRPVSAASVERLVVGLNWTLVEGPNGCGLAHTPERGTSGCKPVPNTSELGNRSLKELAELVHSWNPFETAIGVAAINAHYNRFELEGAATNGLDVIENISGPVTTVGSFKLGDRNIDNLRVVETHASEDQYPPEAADTLLATSEVAVITASALVNKSLPGLLDSCKNTQTALVGPGTPLASALHFYGVDVLSGLLVEDVDAVANLVSAGASIQDIKPHCRYLTIEL
ncbi:DUF2478 domain-containing protein [Arenicellales bacterium nBUS_48]